MVQVNNVKFHRLESNSWYRLNMDTQQGSLCKPAEYLKLVRPSNVFFVEGVTPIRLDAVPDEITVNDLGDHYMVTRIIDEKKFYFISGSREEAIGHALMHGEKRVVRTRWCIGVRKGVKYLFRSDLRLDNHWLRQSYDELRSFTSRGKAELWAAKPFLVE